MPYEEDDEPAMTAPVSPSSRPWVTLKYGGTSVSFEKTWKSIACRIKELLPKYRVVLVLSALSQVSLTRNIHACQPPWHGGTPPAAPAWRCHCGGITVVSHPRGPKMRDGDDLLAACRWVEGGDLALHLKVALTRSHAGAAILLRRSSCHRMPHILRASLAPTLNTLSALSIPNGVNFRA